MISEIGVVGEQRLEHTQPDGLVHDPADQGGALAAGEDQALAGDQVRQHPLQPGATLLGRQPGQLLQVDLVEQDLLEPADQRVVGVGLGLAVGAQPDEALAEVSSHGIVTDLRDRDGR